MSLLTFALHQAKATVHLVTANGDRTFSPAELTIQAGDTVRWENRSGNHNVNGSKADFPNNPEGFFNGDASADLWVFEFVFKLPGTYRYQCDPHVAFNMFGTIVVAGVDGYPVYPIGNVNTENADGVADSLGVLCEVSGTVYGVNLRTSGLLFNIINDAHEGIGVFSSSKTFGYAVKEGDKVRVLGKVDQFRGLTQMATDSLILVSSGNALQTPVAVSNLEEAVEGKLVTLSNVKLANPAQWTNSGSGFNVDLTDGTVTIQARIYNTTDIYGQLAPAGTFNITGVVGQFDNSSPFLSGYQLIPRSISDINPYNTSEPEEKYKQRTIGAIDDTDENGVALFKDTLVELKAIVYGVDLRGGTGLQFTAIDESGGITIFDSGKDFDYVVTEGDEIVIQGKVTQFNGLLQIDPDTLYKVASGQMLQPAREVTMLDESTENQLITIKNVTLVDPTKWTNSGSGFNVDITDGANTFLMRIDNDVNIFGSDPPSGAFNVTGIGTQFDSSNPYTSGYQIIPRYRPDIDLETSSLDAVLQQSLRWYPNPVSDYVMIDHPKMPDVIQIIDLNGRVLRSLQPVSHITRVDTKDLRAGTYYLRCLSGQKWTIASIIKQN